MRIFISYRRKTWPFTHRLAERLREKLEADVFVDIDSIDEDNFQKSILRHLRASDMFVLVVSEQTFDPERIHQPNDWVRREVAEALRLNLPIVLALVEGQAPPPPDQLPPEIQAITAKQGIEFYPVYFDAGIEKLSAFIQQVARRRSASTKVPEPQPTLVDRVPIWVWIAVVVAAGVVFGGLAVIARSGSSGLAGAAQSATQTTTQAEATEATPSSPADQPASSVTGTPIPPGMPGNPVTANDEWRPVVVVFDGVEMALVPAGCFMMGSEDGDADEQPVSEQCFDRPFWIDLTEVTQTQFGDLGYFVGELRPMERVTWSEAAQFCEGRGVRLPTEAEWEYAARGPDNLIYPWGDTFIAQNVVFEGNSNEYTWEVGSKPGGASWVGALDMSGNVQEWVSTIYATYPYDENDGRERAAGQTISRVIRGGSYVDAEDRVRATFRYLSLPTNRGEVTGFRCARDYGADDSLP